MPRIYDIRKLDISLFVTPIGSPIHHLQIDVNVEIAVPGRSQTLVIVRAHVYVRECVTVEVSAVGC